LNPYAADPHWGAYIFAYFFLGGLAAGATAAASLVDLVGDPDDRRAVAVAHYLAIPLLLACGALLIVDLNRPDRFWHMLIASETGRPMFKWWSPMSVGSWALSAFGAFATLAFLGTAAADGRLGTGRAPRALARLRSGLPGRLVALGGVATGLFLGAYTGALLTATNQPIWADSTWIAPLFLASSFSTGLSAIILLHPLRRPASPAALLDRLERADAWALALEFLALAAFVLSIGPLATRALGRWPGSLIPLVVVPFGLVLPLLLKRIPGHLGSRPGAWLALLGGLALRYAVLGLPAAFRASTH